MTGRQPHHRPNPGQPAAGVRQIGRPGARPGPGLGAIGQHGHQQLGQRISRGGHRWGRGGGAVAGFPRADRGALDKKTHERGRELLRLAIAALVFVAFFYGNQFRRTTAGQPESIRCWRFMPVQRRHAGCNRWRADHGHSYGWWRFIWLTSWRVSNVSAGSCRGPRSRIGEHCQQPESIQGNAAAVHQGERC